MAGAGYKLFTTGSVLTAAEVNTYLNEQTVMVFNDATARTTALSGVLAEGMVSYLKSTKVVEIYNGTAWASLDDPNAIQNTIVDAKGDLISASGNDVPARLAVGNNGETLVADSSATTGLRYTAGNAVGNPVLNSAMQIWQRGTSNVTTANAYTADRWQKGGGTHFGVSRQTTSDTTNLPFIQYCARIQRTAGSTTITGMDFAQSFESINTTFYAGKTVTLSFYARAGSNYSAINNTLNGFLYTGTGTDQNIIVSYTGIVGAVSTSPALTTTWQRFTATGTIASNVTEMALYFIGTPSGTAGANDYYEITGIQIDVGSVALPFRTYSATLGGELAACQRFYQRQTLSASGRRWGTGFNASTTAAAALITFPVTMRTSPTALEQTGTASDYTVAYETSTVACNSVPTFSSATENAIVINFPVASGLTAGQGIMARSAVANAYLGWSAEL